MESRLAAPVSSPRGLARNLARADGRAAPRVVRGRSALVAGPLANPPAGGPHAGPSSSLRQLELLLDVGPPPSQPKDERFTPRPDFSAFDAEFRFSLDAAATAANALCPRYCTREDSGLLRPWAGERVWCNPPWSQLPWWVDKAWRELQSQCPLSVLLLPDNRMHQRWWQTLVEPIRDRVLGGSLSLRSRFLPGRFHFGTPADPLAQRRKRPPCGVVLLIFAQVP